MTLKESLMTVKDFRIDRCKKHNLCDILMIVLIGYLTGCKELLQSRARWKVLWTIQDSKILLWCWKRPRTHWKEGLLSLHKHEMAFGKRWVEKSLWYRHGQKQKADKGWEIHGVKIFHYKSHGCKAYTKSHEGALEHRKQSALGIGYCFWWRLLLGKKR